MCWAYAVPAFVAICSMATTVIIAALRHREAKYQRLLNLITAKKIERLETIGSELADFIQGGWDLHAMLYPMIAAGDTITYEMVFPGMREMAVKGNALALRLNPVTDKDLMYAVKSLYNLKTPKKLEEIMEYATELENRISSVISEAHVSMGRAWEEIGAEAGYKKRCRLKTTRGH